MPRDSCQSSHRSKRENADRTWIVLKSRLRWQEFKHADSRSTRSFQVKRVSILFLDTRTTRTYKCRSEGRRSSDYLKYLVSLIIHKTPPRVHIVPIVCGNPQLGTISARRIHPRWTTWLLTMALPLSHAPQPQRVIRL